MLGLVDYGTDDDDDNNNDNNSSNSNVLNANKTTTSSSSSSSSSVTINDKGQKVKKLDFSILPKEIQEALARNDDDDDDDDDDKKIKRNSINSNKGTKGNLLSLLPKPKHSIDNSNTTTIINDKSDVKSKGFNYVSLSESTSTKKDDISNKHNDINDDDDDDDDDNDGTDANPILFDINSYNKPQQASSFSSSSSSSSTITQKENPPSQTIAWEQYYANDAPVGPTLPSDQHIQNYSNYNYNQDYNMQYQEIDNNQQSNPNNKRKRERDIEQLLLNGNVDAIQELGNIQEINKVNQWNQVQYLNQKEMAQQIHQQYSINKAGMTNITSVQNKRHQINSLALKAAETELALLDSRTNLARNKQQAKQKYGW